MKQYPILRNDDFDPRYDLETVMKFHKEFVQRDLIETIAVQATRNGAMAHHEDVVEYINNTSHYNVALHGWDHEDYGKMDRKDIVKHLSASLYIVERQFAQKPTVFYPPWNSSSKELELACEFLGLELSYEAVDMGGYIRDPERYQNIPAIYFHMWEQGAYEMLPQLLDIIKTNYAETLSME